MLGTLYRSYTGFPYDILCFLDQQSKRVKIFSCVDHKYPDYLPRIEDSDDIPSFNKCKYIVQITRRKLVVGTYDDLILKTVCIPDRSSEIVSMVFRRVPNYQSCMFESPKNMFTRDIFKNCYRNSIDIVISMYVHVVKNTPSLTTKLVNYIINDRYNQ